MIDLQYNKLIEILEALTQNFGSNFSANVIKPIVQHMSVPQVARAYPWKKTTRPFSLTTSVDQLEYPLPYDFDKFFYVKNKYGRLTELSAEEFRFRFPDRSDRKAQDFSFYAIEEFQGVRNQITSAETVTVESDNAADTATVLIRGDVDGYDDYEELALNGTTPVPSTKTFSSVAYVTKSQATQGRVTVKGATSSTTLTVIPPEHLTAQYKRMLIDTNPSEALTMVGSYLTLSFRPVRDYDVFRVPADLVILNALALIGWERRDVTNQLSIEKKYQQELAIAVKRERKSYAIDSKMELANETRKVIPDDYPLSDI